MKPIRPFLAILIFVSFFLPAKSQWIPCQGIEGANCGSIVTQDSFLFIEGPGGIYRRQIDDPIWDTACLKGGFMKIRSTGDALFCFGGAVGSTLCRSMDNGLTWEYMDLQYEYRNTENVDSVILLDTYNNGLLRSFDDGGSWTEIDPSASATEIEWIFSQDGILYCYLEDVDSLYRSDDYGMSWTIYPLTGVIGDAGQPYLYDQNLWLSSGNKFYIYNDVTDEWMIRQDTLPGQIYSVTFIEDSETLCCYTNNGFFRFNEQDLTWEDASQGLENLRCWDACRVGGAIYMATASGPYSKTGNEEWIPQYDDLFGWEITQVFVVESRIYALANGRIYYSDDISNGFEALETQGYCSRGQIIVTDKAWYLGSDCGFSISVDTGQTWTEHNAGIEGHRIFQFAVTDHYYFAEISQPSGHGLFRSRNDSITWEKVPNELGDAYFYDLDVINNVLFVIVGSNSGLYKSTDNGTTFEAIPEVGNENSSLFIKNNKIFILRNSNDVLFSTDSGDSWEIWISGQEDKNISCIDITDTEETTVLGGYHASWNPVNYLELFIPAYPSGIDIIDNLPANYYSSISNVLFNNGSIFACPSSGGLWYRDDLAVGMNENEATMRESSSHLKLYPNPATDLINLYFDDNLSQKQYQVIDYSGKMIMKGIMQDGSTLQSVNISGLPQGIYLIMIWDDNILASGKFIKTN
jgi:photosystem II stability/assembly factor-like uncharacterized protein